MARLSKAEFEALAHFRYQLRRFLRFSEDVTQENGITPLQYQLMLQIKGFPGRDWASIGELAERLQSKHHGAVALISRCEALGLVRRQTSGSDLRQVEVHLTPEGEECIGRLARLHRNELDSLHGLLAVASGPNAAKRRR
jgi:DNA-binding MarR family transcriptional regulator